MTRNSHQVPSSGTASGKRTALVTGGTSGIGAAIASRLTHEGFEVLVCARTQPAGPSERFYPCDVSDPLSVRALADLFVREGRKIDVLVNNVGLLVETNFAADPPSAAEIDAQVTLTLSSALYVTSAFAPLLRRDGASWIVFVGSGFGHSPTRRAPIYSAAKAGLSMFARALGAQFGSSGVRVLELVPPVVDTPATAHRKVAKVTPDAVADAMMEGMRRKRRVVFVGPARAIPLLSRLAPGILEKATLEA